MRLLTRTTRSVSLTKRVNVWCTPQPRDLRRSRPNWSVGELREKPAGPFGSRPGDHAIHSVLWPKLAKFLPGYPDIKVEIVIDYG